MFLKIGIVILLIILNAVFAATEAAFLSVDKIKLLTDIKNKNKDAIRVKKLLDRPSSFLATIQIAITLSGFLASAVAAESFVEILVIQLSFLNISKALLKTILLILVTLILSYFTLVFGELVPKRIGMNRPKKVSYAMSKLVVVLMKIGYPFVYILTKSTNMFAKLLKINDIKKEELTSEEIKMIIQSGKEDGVLEDKEAEYIFNIFEFNDKNIGKIITKKENVLSLKINSTPTEVFECIKLNRYTRYPIYDENNIKIVGILNVKDIIQLYITKEKFEIKNIMRKPKFVYEDNIIDDVFNEMQTEKENMVVVVNNKKDVLGIVTLEDILEEIVGNIFDEYDM